MEEKTLKEFAAVLAEVNGEPFEPVLKRVYHWRRIEHLPVYYSEKRGVLVTTADPYTFQPPPSGMPRAKSGNGWVTLTEAAERTGLGRGSIHWRIKSGALPGAYQNERGQWLIPENELMAAV